jgi:phosphatidate cytidylyltransferase
LSELKKRILFALIAAPLFILVVWLGGWYFRVVMTVIALIIQWEMACMFAMGNTRPNRVFMYLIGIWVMLLPYIPYTALFGLGLFLLLVLTEIIRGYDRSYNSLVNTIFCGLYAPIGVLTLILLRDKVGGEPMASFALTMVVIFMVWGNDVFAFIFGKNFGKNLLAPKISPKKTWEGFFGGIFGSIVAFFLLFYLLSDYPYSILVSLPLIIIVSVFGPIGDLAASKLKRLYDTKDSSNMLPGHGGFFDRFDAMILAAPAVYFYLEVIRILGII